jgi:hypothetical protein
MVKVKIELSKMLNKIIVPGTITIKDAKSVNYCDSVENKYAKRLQQHAA